MKNSATRTNHDRPAKTSNDEVSGVYDVLDVGEEDPRVGQLARRALRLRRQGDFRKAANAYGELTSVEPHASRWWVLLATTLATSGRGDEACKALRQATYLLRQRGASARVSSVQALETRIAAGEFSLAAPRSRGLARRRDIARAA